MLRNFTNFLSLLVVVLIIASCHNDVGDVNPGSETTTQITVPLNFPLVDSDLVGYVYDDTGNPIQGAEVSVYNTTTSTNEFGVFSVNNIKVDPQGTFIKVIKDDYLIGSDLIYPNSNGKGTSRIMMMKVLNTDAFDAEEGGVIEIVGGGTLTVSPQSLIRSNGSLYDGAVKASAYRLSPLDENVGAQMSGGLLGIDEKGRHRVLSTYGILSLELRGFDNQPLRLKSGALANLSLPVDDELKSKVEEGTKAWYFDFEDGLWHEKSETSFENGNFETTIDKLGNWNLSISDAVAQVCGRLVYENGLPAINYDVQIKNNGLLSRIGITDQEGYFCGKVPAGESLVMQVLHPVCKDILKEEPIGQFETLGTLGDIAIPAEDQYLSGQIECSGELSGNATIIIQSENHTSLFTPDETGVFHINKEEFLCGDISSFTIFAYDNETESLSQPISLSEDFSESIKLEVCQSLCEVGAIFEYEKEDYCTDGAFSKVFLQLIDGSGEFSYRWPDGSGESYLFNPQAGTEICVDVVDLVTECEYKFCDVVRLHQRLGIQSIRSFNNECLITSGYIDLELRGGKAPFSYNWYGPDGLEFSGEKAENLPPGSYEVLIFDAGECAAEASVEVYDVTTPIQSTIEDFCDVTVVTIEDDAGYKPYTYTWDAGQPVGNQLYVYAPGVYKLTVTDANLCTRSTSLTISKAGTLPLIDPSYNCNVDVAIFDNLEMGYDYFYRKFGTNDKIDLNFVQGKVEVPILDAGYRFEIGSENQEISGCVTTELVEMPRFEGLEVLDVVNVSCESCADGSIVYNADFGAQCIDCNPGEVIVIDAENGTNVTNINNEQMLEKGEYYVVVLDSNSECFIAHELVVVE